MKEVELSDGTVVEFPATMSNTEIKSALDARFGNQQKTKVEQQDQSFFRFGQRDPVVNQNAPLPGGMSASSTPFDQAATIPSDVTRERSADIARRVGQATKENLDIPAGMAGAATGFKLGAPLGPIPAAVGTVTFGALGTFGGSIASDALSEEDLDFARATENSLLSAGIDIATLGAGRVLKPAYFAIRNKLGFDPRDAAEEIINKIAPGGAGGQVGTEESVARTQRIFSEEGASLTPFQTGNASTAQILGDRIARIGIFSESVIEKNIQEQSRIINDRISNLFSDISAPNNELGPAAIGNIVFDSIQTGKLALQDSYARGLDKISKDYGQAQVSRNAVLKEAKDFLDSKSFDGGAATELDDVALREAERFISDLENKTPTLTVDSLFKFEKKLQTKISQLSDRNSAGFNSQASAQLADLSSRIRQRTNELFEGVSPELSTKFASLKNQYSNGMNELIPQINRNMIENASSTNMFAAIGNTFISTGKAEQVESFYRSIDRAFAEAKRAGRESAFKSSEEIKEIVRQGYVSSILPDLGPNFDLRMYSKLARELEKPAKEEKAKAVLGDKYKPFKDLVNAMSIASKRPESNIGELMIRSKEYSAATLLLGGTLAGGPLGAGAAATLLTMPVFLAKAATNPKNINRIIAFDKKSFSSGEALETAATNMVVDIYNTFSEEDKKEIKEELKYPMSNQEAQQ